MTGVIVTDHFSATLDGVTLSDLPVDTMIYHTSQGKHSKSTSVNQVRINWEVGDLPPGALATLQMIVWTDLNPGGNQEYTSVGEYTLNSGPVAKWFNEDGHQFAMIGLPVNVTAY
jgi:hypothetical protein